MNTDPFRPRRDPARAIYDAFQNEAKKRGSLPTEVWSNNERSAVWMAARDYSHQKDIPVLTMEDVEKAEMPARGHTDYGAKWAHGVAEMLRAR